MGIDLIPANEPLTKLLQRLFYRQLVEERAYNLQNLPVMKRDGLGNDTGIRNTPSGQVSRDKDGRGIRWNTDLTALAG